VIDFIEWFYTTWNLLPREVCWDDDSPSTEPMPPKWLVKQAPELLKTAADAIQRFGQLWPFLPRAPARWIADFLRETRDHIRAGRFSEVDTAKLERYRREIEAAVVLSEQLKPSEATARANVPKPVDQAPAIPASDATPISASEGATAAALPAKKRFRVALSFPGERRDFVEGVAGTLSERIGKERVFYDKYHEAELARPNLDTHLQRLYHQVADLIVVFLCSDYEQKEWCGLEWRAIRALIKNKQDHAIMLIRFDETEISGLYPIDGYVSVNDRIPSEIARLILERLDLID